MASSLVPGTPVGQLFQGANPYGPRQVMSPRASGGCPYGNLPSTPPTPPGLPRGVLFAPSLLLIDERLHVQRGQEEASASRLTFRTESESVLPRARSCFTARAPRNQLRGALLFTSSTAAEPMGARRSCSLPSPPAGC